MVRMCPQPNDHLPESSLVVYPFTKMREIVRDATMLWMEQYFTNSSYRWFHLTSWGSLHGKLTWLSTIILSDVNRKNWLFSFLIYAFKSLSASDQVFFVPAFFAKKWRYLKRPSLKSLASLLLALPKRASDYICCMMTSMVMGMLVCWSLECRRGHTKIRVDGNGP